MGRLLDFGIRRIIGYTITWIIVIVVLLVIYGGKASPSSGAFLLIWIFAFLLSLRYTGRMKVRQHQRRQMKAWRKAHRREAKLARRGIAYMRPWPPPPRPPYPRGKP